MFTLLTAYSYVSDVDCAKRAEKCAALLRRHAPKLAHIQLTVDTAVNRRIAQIINEGQADAAVRKRKAPSS
jgi:hypothetical protein